MTVEVGHALAHQITADIGKCLSHSHILVHIEPCPGGCESCAVECPKLAVNSPVNF
jgi:NAD-dependent dihydropyrimidine dehydrogenase PreA subunit